MALSKAQAGLATLAFNRFGLGAKPGQLARLGRDPKQALIDEVETPGIALVDNRDGRLPSYAQACRIGLTPSPGPANAQTIEHAARIAKAIAAPVGFVERLVVFWSNHFSMSVQKSGIIKGTIGQWERDCIRVNVLGKFSDMLVQTIAHPAMIKYLDNDNSIGPASEENKSRSYTENLARELLELHTVGLPDGDFTYYDGEVAALAYLLTGWSLQKDPSQSNAGQFVFVSSWHQPGLLNFFGRRYSRPGKARGEEALRFLADHPRTALHIARKLAVHFVMDEPDGTDPAASAAFETLVNGLKDTFVATRGDLKAVALKLLDSPEAWAPRRPGTGKLRTPYEYVAAMLRGMNMSFPPDSDPTGKVLKGLFQPTWEWPTPDGYPDQTAYWLTPHGVAFRLDAAQVILKQLLNDDGFDPAARAKDLFGKSLTKVTKERIGRAGNAMAGMTILFCCPEFQRR
jgi:uncharacterized protein (DUF1800 family)